MLKVAWFKKIVESEKAHSSFIMKIMTKMMMNQLLNINMLNSYQECICKLFERNCCITQCYKCFDFDHMTKFCKNEEHCFKCTDKHHIEKCIVLMNKRWCMNCNDSHEFWMCSCFKWKLQIKKSEEIFQNRLIRYLITLKNNHSFSSFFLNFLNSMNLLNSMNSSCLIIISMITDSQDVNELIWQVIKVKKRRVDHSSCMISDSENMKSEQIQKCSIRKCKRLTRVKSI